MNISMEGTPGLGEIMFSDGRLGNGFIHDALGCDSIFKNGITLYIAFQLLIALFIRRPIKAL